MTDVQHRVTDGVASGEVQRPRTPEERQQALDDAIARAKERNAEMKARLRGSEVTVTDENLNHRPWAPPSGNAVCCKWDSEPWPCNKARVDEALSWLERKTDDGEPLWRRSYEDNENVVESAIDALEGRTPFQVDGQWHINIDGDIR